MAILYLSDVIKRVGLKPEKVKLLRHALTDKGFKDCYDLNLVKEYTQIQKNGFSKGYEYWIVFISDKGTRAKLYACYKVQGSSFITSEKTPVGFPHPEWFNSEKSYFKLEHIDILREYESKLIIDWGNSARMWHQKGTTEKEIVAIQADKKKVFSGFENLMITFDELKDIIDNPTIYSEWHSALSSVNAVYLIVDCISGKQYVGSAYNKDGLLGRWSVYIATRGHGNNKLMKDLVCKNPNRYHHFQFSVLQILPKSLTNDEIIQVENIWKRKLLSKEFGLNDN